MGEEEKTPEVEQEGAEGKKSFFSKKNIIILGGLAALLLVVSLVVVLFVIKPMFAKEEQADDVDIESIGKKSAGVIYEVKDEFIVNVAGTGATRYLKVALAFEVEDGGTQSEMGDRITEIRDLVIIILGTKKLDQLDNIAARDEIKREILNKVNDILKSGHALNVFYTDFVIQ
ncbi:MAG: flagellar basal body-associated FliL family protein [Candidatus Aureabacteria bacterium]|nr:flagellar basal body-associated FliL family protein [Candidatus Auribacterota bacterium]